MLFGNISSMRAFRASWRRRQACTVTAGLLLAGTAVSASAGLDPASAAVTAARPAGTTALHYRGYTFDIPASWAVIRLARHPDSCVRFDEHVVYVGTPGASQSCPSWLFGTTEAMIIEPGPAGAAHSSVENPVSREITVTAPRISITATFDADPGLIYTMLAGAGLPAPAIQPPNPAILDIAEGKTAPASTEVIQSTAAGTAPPASTAPPATATAAAAPAAACCRTQACVRFPWPQARSEPPM